MKTIAVIGDSHTWGEGVGAERNFVPPVCCGDLRAVPFGYPSYVNLLRENVNRETGSSCLEYEWDGGLPVEAGTPLALAGRFTLARVFFCAEGAAAEAVIAATEGEGAVTFSVPCDTGAFSSRVYVTHLRMPNDGEAEGLTVTCVGGERVLVQRVELYRGAYAVVNCGIGSCPVGKYVDRYMERYISPLAPHAILFEGNTINDWLQLPTPEAYAVDLLRMLNAQRGLTPRVLWHTVTPIGGNQINDKGIEYDAYVNAMRDVARENGVVLEDCNARMNALLAAMPENERAPYFFADPWHPNGTGHRLYAEMILPALKAML